MELEVQTYDISTSSTREFGCRLQNSAAAISFSANLIVFSSVRARCATNRPCSSTTGMAPTIPSAAVQCLNKVSQYFKSLSHNSWIEHQHPLCVNTMYIHNMVRTASCSMRENSSRKSQLLSCKHNVSSVCVHYNGQKCHAKSNELANVMTCLQHLRDQLGHVILQSIGEKSQGLVEENLSCHRVRIAPSHEDLLRNDAIMNPRLVLRH